MSNRLSSNALILWCLLIFCASVAIWAGCASPAHAITITQDGTILRNQTISGDLSIQASNVTIENCKFPTAKFINGGKWTLSHHTGIKVIGCEFPVLGRGVTGVTSHIVEWWDCDGTVFANNKVDITIEAGLDNSVGGEWHFDDRHRTSYGNVIRIHCKRASYAIWRWRGDHSTNVGSFGNTFRRDTLIIDGVGGQLLPSSSADCGYGNYDAQCVGAWNWTMDSCLVDASACSGPVEMVWQGGMHGLLMRNTTLNVPIRAFDLAGSKIENTTIRSAKWTDEFSRPVVSRGLVLTCVSIGTSTIASKLVAAGSIVTEPCVSPMPPSPIADLSANDGNATPLRWTVPARSVRYSAEASSSPGFLPQFTTVAKLLTVRDGAIEKVPGAVGKRDSAWVKVPGTGRGVFYRIYSYNAFGQRSLASNMVVKVERPTVVPIAATAAVILLASLGGIWMFTRRKEDSRDV